jgi:hypothetical protein
MQARPDEPAAPLQAGCVIMCDDATTTPLLDISWPCPAANLLARPVCLPHVLVLALLRTPSTEESKRFLLLVIKRGGFVSDRAMRSLFIIQLMIRA